MTTLKKFLWHPRGIPRVLRLLRTAALDLRYGGRYLGWAVSNGDDRKGWHGSQNSNYEAMALMFQQVILRADDVIVDIGCGKGRLFNWLLSRGVKNRMIGLEVDEAIAAFTRARLRSYPQIEIRIGDVETEGLPADGTIFYMFNPFAEQIVQTVARQLAGLRDAPARRDGTRPQIVFYNCNKLKPFEADERWTITKLGPITHTQWPAAIIAPRVRQ